ncbi:hypothetical protein ES703_118479 [subsurface metagenome]
MDTQQPHQGHLGDLIPTDEHIVSIDPDSVAEDKLEGVGIRALNFGLVRLKCSGGMCCGRICIRHRIIVIPSFFGIKIPHGGIFASVDTPIASQAQIQRPRHVAAPGRIVYFGPNFFIAGRVAFIFQGEGGVINRNQLTQAHFNGYGDSCGSCRPGRFLGGAAYEQPGKCEQAGFDDGRFHDRSPLGYLI